MFTQYSIVLPDSAIRHYRTKLMYSLLMNNTSQPHSTAVDCLIADISNQNDISYLYITHDVASRCVTHKKEKRDEPIAKNEDEEYMSVYSMRYQLSVEISNFVMIKLYW